MSSRHCTEVYWLAVLAVSQLAIALVVSEAVLDADDDPEDDCQLISANTEVPATSQRHALTYHKFVKTTPKPRATKKSRGELVGPGLLPLALPEVVAEGGAEEVVEDMMADLAANPSHSCEEDCIWCNEWNS